MIDLALDPVTRDLILPPRPLDGAARAAQAVGIRLRAWLGDWFLDKNHGVPYLEEILGKKNRLEIVEAILRAQILDVRSIRAISSFSISLDPVTRKATVIYEASSEEGLIKDTIIIKGV